MAPTAALAAVHPMNAPTMARGLPAAVSGWRAPSALWEEPAADGVASAVGLIEALGTRGAVARGSSLFFDGDLTENYYRVVSGAVELVNLLPDGRRQIADFPIVGDFSASRPAANTKPRPKP